MDCKPNRVKTTALVGDMVNEFYTNIRQAPALGRPVAWCVGATPFELLLAMDISYVHMENYAAMLSARRAEGEMTKAAEGIGFPLDVCSYCRIAHGGALLQQANQTGSLSRPELLVPLPDFLVCSNQCQTQGNWYDSFRRFLNVPGFLLDVPPSHDDKQLAENIAYVTDQLREYVSFLENTVGRRLDWEKLSNIMALIKEGSQIKKECYDLGRNIPSPMSEFDWFISIAPANILRGREKSVSYWKTLKSELEARVRNGVAAVPGEKYRLYWDHVAVWFKLRELSEMFASRQACVVASTYLADAFYAEPDHIDPSDPLGSIAREQCMGFSMRDLDYRINLVSRLVEERRLDGLIMFSSRTCRPFGIGQYDIVEAIQKRHNIPGIVLEGDHCDRTMHSDIEWNNQLEPFFEALASRKKG